MNVASDEPLSLAAMEVNYDTFKSVVLDSNIYALEKMLDSGFDVNMDHPCDGDTGLHMAALYSDIKVINLLINSGWKIYINSFDVFSISPLINAAVKERYDVIELLILNGADVNARDEQHVGNTVIREVMENANYTLIKFLLSFGADVNIPGWMQLTSKDKAVERFEKDGNEENLEILRMVNGSYSR